MQIYAVVYLFMLVMGTGMLVGKNKLDMATFIATLLQLPLIFNALGWL